MYRDSFKQDSKTFCRTGDHVNRGKMNIISVQGKEVQTYAESTGHYDILLNNKVLETVERKDDTTFVISRDTFEKLVNVLTKNPCIFYYGFVYTNHWEIFRSSSSTYSGYMLVERINFVTSEGIVTFEWAMEE